MGITLDQSVAARPDPALEYFAAFDYKLECRKGIANGNADFLFCLPAATCY